MTKMLAFHNNQAIKDEYLGRVEAHREADQIVKGLYWENGKGCAVGCTIHASNHAMYETLLGIPVAIARLEDSIFEGLPNDRAMMWPSEFLQAIPVGKDLSLVTPKFLYWLLTTVKVNPGIEHEIVKDAVAQCAEIVRLWSEGQSYNESAAWSATWSAESAWSAAWSAASAASAARSAASAASAAWSAERSAAWSAESAARSAAWSAESAASAAWSAESAWSAAYVLMADKLIELLKAA